MNVSRAHVLAVLAAFLIVAAVGAVALTAFFVVQSDAALANNIAGLVRFGQAGMPIAR